jgi:hypothetical protein
MNIEAATLPNLKESNDAILNRIKDELLELGVAECPKEITDRLVIIEENSKFNNDSRMVCEGFENVLNAIEISLGSKSHLTSEQKLEGELAAFLHDIGKSGAAEADASGQIAVIRLFSEEGLRDQNQTVFDAVRNCFPDEYDNVIKNLAKSGVNGGMTMRQFYDKHAEWTHDILEKFQESVPERARVVAGSHHIDRGINPYHLSEEEVPAESLLIGALEHYVDILEEKILMVVDKYQASISRSNSPHERAMEFIRKIFSEKYAGDPIMNLIINTIDELGKKNALFPKTKEKYLSLRNVAKTNLAKAA